MLKKRGLLTLLLFCVSLCLSLGAGELLLRKLMKSGLDVWDERNLMYRHDPLLGWFPQPNSSFTGKGDRISHNSRGFRDIEHNVDTRRGIMVLGDSFVWGYEVDQEARFTDRLREMFRDVPVYNLGVSGYGTDQEYLLLQREFDFYHPAIVFLEFTTDNDMDDNGTDMRYGTYFKPYFRAEGGGLKLCGVPVPRGFNYFVSGGSLLARSYLVRLAVKAYYQHRYPPPADFADPTEAIIRAMNNYARSKGAVLLVGLQQRSAALERFLDAERIPRLDLTVDQVFDDPGRHWTPAGHRLVAEKIHEFIVRGGYLQGAAGTAQR
jgi:hypothetical protein